MLVFQRLGFLLKVSEISGGITNILWKLQPQGKTLDPVVVRIFGKQTDKIIDRDHEKRVLGPLNNAGFGAKVLLMTSRFIASITPASR